LAMPARTAGRTTLLSAEKPRWVIEPVNERMIGTTDVLPEVFRQPPEARQLVVHRVSVVTSSSCRPTAIAAATASPRR
jgi:hypothetical protein